MKKESQIPSVLPPLAPLRGSIGGWSRGRFIGLIVTPLVLWAVFYAVRPFFYHAWCAVDPSPCTFTSVNPFDRMVFQYSSMRADFWSNVLQNLTGLIVFTLPWLWQSAGKDKRQTALQESFYLLTITFWNLCCLELVHLISQRPRPVVFNSPFTDGANISQYTSFYSGHTSFAALATLGLFLVAKRHFRESPHRKRINALFFGYYLLNSCLVGLLRILGGRHFPTDVIIGWIVGSLFATFFNYYLFRPEDHLAEPTSAQRKSV
jgi:membrane-associated phospholipid phosphatase